MNGQAGASRGSLRVRMLLSATLVLVVFLGVMGLVLDNAYRQSAEQSVSERLLLHIYALMAASVENNSADILSLYLPEELQEPQLNSMGSGLYGLVFSLNGEEIWRSQSALGLVLDDSEKTMLLSANTPGVVTFSEFPGTPAHDPLFFITYPVIWQSESGEARFIYVVMQDFVPYRNEVTTFRNHLWGWLVAGVIVLVGLQAAIMYWGLLPVTGLEEDLKAIEEGRQEYLVGTYPSEINGVTHSLNLLLSEERQQRERYRTTMADLAHSLKTPLAILKAEADKPDQVLTDMKRAMDLQVSRMNDIVSYQLSRAVGGPSRLARNMTPIKPIIEKLVAALQQVYHDKGLDFRQQVDNEVLASDERDLMELLGNLLDNACKYGRSVVSISAGMVENQLQLVIEDDGPGILPADRIRVLERGLRLDSREAGQGIGLAVVAEIVDRYSGSVSIEDSTLGGARVVVRFSAPGAN